MEFLLEWVRRYKESKELIQTLTEELQKEIDRSEKILNINTNGKKRIKNVFERSRKSWMQRFCL